MNSGCQDRSDAGLGPVFGRQLGSGMWVGYRRIADMHQVRNLSVHKENCWSHGPCRYIGTYFTCCRQIRVSETSVMQPTSVPFITAIIGPHQNLVPVGNLLFQLLLKGCDVAEMVSSRPLNAEAQGQPQARPFMMCGVQSGTWTGFSPSTSVSSPVTIISHGLICSLLCHRCCMLLADVSLFKSTLKNQISKNLPFAIGIVHLSFFKFSCDYCCVEVFISASFRHCQIKNKLYGQPVWKEVRKCLGMFQYSHN